MKKLIFLILVCFSSAAIAQQKWNLRSVVDYAMNNNLNVRMSDLQAKNAALILKQSKLSQYPNASFSASLSGNSGSNQNPVTFSRITETYLSSGMQLQSSADIFNFSSKRNAIAANEWELQAAKAQTDKLKNDIALSAANAYLQILLANEQLQIAKVQLQQSQSQLTTIRKQVNAGSLPELNASQAEAQVAMDSANVINASGNVSQSILNLKAFMNIDAAAAFEVETPAVEQIPLESFAELQPQDVYQSALANQPKQRYNEFKLKAAEKNRLSAKGAQYPSFSIFGTLGSGYNNKYQTLTGITSTVNGTLLIGTVNVGGTDYTVYTPNVVNTPIYKKPNYTHQLSDNFRQSVGLSISIPIFNGGSLRSNYERSKINVQSLQLQKEIDNQKLKQDIYAAYNAAFVALQKFNASKKTVETNEKAYQFAEKRFKVGMLSTLELLTQQNNLLQSKLEYSFNHYDYVFKIKVLEFYKGVGLKL